MKPEHGGTGPELAPRVVVVASAAAALPDPVVLAGLMERSDAACARGYFLPDEEELIRREYHGYLITNVEASGRAIADLRQPGIKPADAPKRISGELRETILKRVF